MELCINRGLNPLAILHFRQFHISYCPMFTSEGSKIGRIIEAREKNLDQIVLVKTCRQWYRSTSGRILVVIQSTQ